MTERCPLCQCKFESGYHEPWCAVRASSSEVSKEKWRTNYVPAPHFFALNHACDLVNKALDGFGCYLVGSALERRDYRDVDVRFIMSDEAYNRMFRDEHGWLNPLWSLMCTSIAVWMSQQTGLPIDFQIQMQTRANADHKGKRSALGIFLDYPGERPSDEKPAPEEGK
jgi:hypothetical protein